MGFDVRGVHVSVEENHGEGQDENGVWVVKLLHHVRIAHTVSLAVEGETSIMSLLKIFFLLKRDAAVSYQEQHYSICISKKEILSGETNLFKKNRMQN